MFANNLSIDTWSEKLCFSFNQEFCLAPHTLHQHRLFSQESIVDLLDNLPKKQIQCYTMVADATNRESIKAVDPDHCSGEELYEAAKSGLFWFNLKRLENFDSNYQNLLDEMFDQLRGRGAPLNGLHEPSCDLLLTSPGAHTHYHIDRGPSALWHLVGTKKLWAYPTMDFNFISQQDMEAIFAGKMLEYLPYDQNMDKSSNSCLLEPGQVVWWPNSAPHRVENNEMCISINCSYKTSASVKRFNIQRANHYMMRPLGSRKPSIAESGISSSIKEFSYRASNRIFSYKPKENFRDDYATFLAIDVSKPGCLKELTTPGKPAFLQ